MTSRTRSLLSLDGVWQLAREQAGIDYVNGFEAEKPVAVPGSFNDLYVDESFRTWMGGVWLKREFVVPDQLVDQRLMLRFGAASYRASVYLNGVYLGAHETGYTPFEFDVSDVVVVGEANRLCVRLENTLSAETVPMGNLGNKPESGQLAGQYPDTPFDFFPYAGLHRPVLLHTCSRTGFLDTVLLKTDLRPAESSGEVAVAVVCVEGRTVGECRSARVSIDGVEGRMECEVVESRFRVELTLRNPSLWGIGEPNLYFARITLFDENASLIDEYVQRFGVREVRIEGNRFLLNGSPVYFQGFGRHEDFPLTGKGLNHAVNIRDHELLKWINANSYRTTHYPYSEELIQLADEQGILLIGEAPAVSVNFDYVTERTRAVHAQALSEMIERDRNSPSIVMWSVANEATSDRAVAKPYFEHLARIARELDGTRPVTMATCKDVADVATEPFDVISVNLYPGWYYLPGQIEAARKEMGRLLDALHAKFHKPILVSEFGADSFAGVHNLPAEQWSEEYQVELVLGLIEEIRRRDFVIGEHVWSFADFRTAQNFARAGGNRKGVFTRDRQPKMIAHFLRKVWAQSRDF